MSHSPVGRLRLDRAAWGRVAVLGAAIVAMAVVSLFGAVGVGGASVGAGETVSGSHATLLSTGGAGPAATLVTAPAVTTSALQLGVAVTPDAICASEASSCNAGTGTARVTMTADTTGQGTLSWPAVEVAFVVETTVYDGVYDPVTGDEPGHDPCANPAGSGNTPCEESNGVPFFTVNAQSIANSIAAANPHSQVSFAMVDYFATGDDWNDGDGVEYHVDIPTFVPSAQFGEQVHLTFQDEVLLGNLYYEDSDFADNFLHTSSITALYGTIVGSGLNWQADTHHVIVWMGSSAPRDPNYPENYCVSSQNGAPTPFGPCDGGTCEPSYPFPGGASPTCEGWVKPQNGVANDSISQLAKTAKQCTDSIGGVCTIDTIDLWATPTDPYSQGWPATSAWTAIGGGPGGRAVIADVTNVLTAGCDLAAATGGTWDGPAFWTCPNGQAGTLQYVPHGSYKTPNTQNPTLFDALKNIGFGPVLNTQIAASTGHPIFTYVPIGNIELAPSLQATAACLRNGEPFRDCQMAPTVIHSGTLTYLGWNWSTNKTTNTMFVGDSWTASFNIIAVGPPYQNVPVDACITQECKAGGSGSVDNGLYTWASYVPASNTSVDTESFPLGSVHVEISVATPLGVAPPPPPPIPPALPVVTQIGVTNTLGIGQVSLQASAAGFLGAGFMRVSMKNKPLALRVAAKSGPMVSKFDAEGLSKRTSVGRFV